MTRPSDLTRLSDAEKNALILALLGSLTAAHERIVRIAVLEARLDEVIGPPKTPDNSSEPPPQDQKQNHRIPTG